MKRIILVLTILSFLCISEQSVGQHRYHPFHYKHPQRVVVVKQRPVYPARRVMIVRQRPIVVYHPRRYYYQPVPARTSITIQARL